jgi:hypothetical protein
MGKLIGVLTGRGGISDMVRDIIAACAKDTGSRVLYDAEPARVLTRLGFRGPIHCTPGTEALLRVLLWRRAMLGRPATGATREHRADRKF